MRQTSPTTLAVADAIACSRRTRDLTQDELAYLVSLHGFEISPDAIGDIEGAQRPTTVDELFAIAHVLDVSPALLLSHVPADSERPEGAPIATGLPPDLVPAELSEWVVGHILLDDESRLRWWQDQKVRLDILTTHLEEQLEGARAELRDLGELAAQEADSAPIERLIARIRDAELAVHDIERAHVAVDMRLDELLGLE